jgi:hypothetical protein
LCGPGSSVGTATDYGLDGPGIESLIVRKQPAVPWSTVWRNVHRSHLPATVTTEWYVVINDIVPTRQRLADINVVRDTVCIRCGAHDTITHRLYTCAQGPVIWTWIKAAIATILRVDHRTIPDAWAHCPRYTLWPSHRHPSVTWILAQYVSYRMQVQSGQSLKDFKFYIGKERWEVYRCPKRQRVFGRYVDVL